MAQLTPLGLIKIMAQVTAIMVISILGSAVACETFGTFVGI
jgi:hypothetical protein